MVMQSAELTEDNHVSAELYVSVGLTVKRPKLHSPTIILDCTSLLLHYTPTMDNTPTTTSHATNAKLVHFHDRYSAVTNLTSTKTNFTAEIIFTSKKLSQRFS